MAVLIKIDMPSDCLFCPMAHEGWCFAIDENCESDYTLDYGRGRLPCCPLVNLSDGLYQVQNGKIWKYQGKGKKHGTD